MGFSFEKHPKRDDDFFLGEKVVGSWDRTSWEVDAESETPPTIERAYDIPLGEEKRSTRDTYRRWFQISRGSKSVAGAEEGAEAKPKVALPSKAPERIISLTEAQVVDTESPSQNPSPSWRSEPGMIEGSSAPVAESGFLPEAVEHEEAIDSAVSEREKTGPLVLKKTPPSDPTLPVEEDLKSRFGANVRSALGPGTLIEGTFSFDAPVCIEGTLNGEVTSTSALIVGMQAEVNARIKVGTLVVLGDVYGPVEADDLVEVRDAGRVIGDVVTKRLVIEEGGLFQGRCSMSEDGEKGENGEEKANPPSAPSTVAR